MNRLIRRKAAIAVAIGTLLLSSHYSAAGAGDRIGRCTIHRKVHRTTRHVRRTPSRIHRPRHIRVPARRTPRQIGTSHRSGAIHHRSSRRCAPPHAGGRIHTGSTRTTIHRSPVRTRRSITVTRRPGQPTVIHRKTHHRRTTHIRREHHPSGISIGLSPDCSSRTRIGFGTTPSSIRQRIRRSTIRGFYGGTHDRLHETCNTRQKIHRYLYGSSPSTVIVSETTPEVMVQPDQIVVPNTTPILPHTEAIVPDTRPLVPAATPIEPTTEPLIPEMSSESSELLVSPEDLGPVGLTNLRPADPLGGESSSGYRSAPGAEVPELENLPADTPPTHLEQGEAAFAVGDYDTSLRLFRRAVIALPGDAYAQLDYGLVNFTLGEYKASAAAFRRAMALDPDLLDRLPDVSTAYGVVGHFERDIESLRDHLIGNPADNDARFLLGAVLFSAGDSHGALPHLSRALHRDSKDTVAYLLRDAALRSISEDRKTRTIMLRPPVDSTRD